MALIKPKCFCVDEEGKKIDHAIWIKHKWTYIQSGRQKRAKKSYKSQSLETGNKRARLHEQQQTATSATSSRLFSLLWRFVWIWPSNAICKQFEFRVRITWWLNRFDAAATPAMPDSNFNIRLADINAHTTHAANEWKSRECERKKQLKARNAMVDGACHSQTALNSHRKYRCLNWIFMSVRAASVAGRVIWISLLVFLPCSISSVALIVKCGAEFKHFFFFSIRLALHKHSRFSRGPFYFHLHWPNDEEQSKMRMEIPLFSSFKWKCSAQRTQKWIGRNLLREIIIRRCSICNSFFMRWIFILQIDVIFLSREISVGASNEQRNQCYFVGFTISTIFFSEMEAKNCSKHLSQTIFNYFIIIYFLTERERERDDGEATTVTFGWKKASCCLITLCKLAFQIM